MRKPCISRTSHSCSGVTVRVRPLWRRRVRADLPKSGRVANDRFAPRRSASATRRDARSWRGPGRDSRTGRETRFPLPRGTCARAIAINSEMSRLSPPCRASVRTAHMGRGGSRGLENHLLTGLGGSRGLSEATTSVGVRLATRARRSDVPQAQAYRTTRNPICVAAGVALRLGAFEGDRCVERAEQRGAAAEEDRDHVHADLVDQAKRECCCMTVAPCRPMTLSPAATLACSIALGTPSVTNVNTGGYGAVGLL